MKTKFKGQILSVAVFAAAIAGAVTTNAMTRQSTFQDEVPGFERVNGSITNCDDHKQCSLIDNGVDCTFGSLRMWGKNGANQCTVPLYEPDQR